MKHQNFRIKGVAVVALVLGLAAFWSDGNRMQEYDGLRRHITRSIWQQCSCQGLASTSDGAPRTDGVYPYPVRGFWHIGVLDLPHSTWEEILMAQIRAINASGMMEHSIVQGIDACFVGRPPPYKGVQLPEPFFSSMYLGSERQYEFATLRRLESYCAANPAGRAMYIHAKGVQHNPSDPEWPFVVAWREFLEYYTLHRSVEEATCHI